MIVGVVLAGGLARRMGGGDKGLRTVAGRSVLSRVLDRLGPQVGRLAINANGDEARFAPFGVPVIADTLPDRPGPLAGVLAGLDWAATQPGAAAVLSAPADCPFLPTDLAARLEAALGQAPMACAASGGRTHPVAALWPLAIRDRLHAALASGLRKVGQFTEDAAIAEWPAEPYDPFFNVNTPDDLEAAERIALTLPF